LLCETTKLRLNFVHCFIQKISLSVLIRIGDLPSANVITELRWILKMQQVSCLFLSLNLFIKWTGWVTRWICFGRPSKFNQLFVSMHHLNDFLFLEIFALGWGLFDFSFCLKMRF
jgi:hypothetical protein